MKTMVRDDIIGEAGHIYAKLKTDNDERFWERPTSNIGVRRLKETGI